MKQAEAAVANDASRVANLMHIVFHADHILEIHDTGVTANSRIVSYFAYVNCEEIISNCKEEYISELLSNE